MDVNADIYCESPDTADWLPPEKKERPTAAYLIGCFYLGLLFQPYIRHSVWSGFRYYDEAGFFIGICVALFICLRKRKWPLPLSVTLIITAYLMSNVIAAALNHVPAKIAAQGVMAWLKGMSALFVLASVEFPGRLWRSFRIVAFAFLAVCLILAAVEVFSGPDGHPFLTGFRTPEGTVRSDAIFAHPNEFGQILTFVLAVQLYPGSYGNFFIPVAFLGNILAHSRTGLLSASFILLIYLFLFKRKTAVFFCCLAVAAVCIVPKLILGPDFSERFDKFVTKAHCIFEQNDKCFGREFEFRLVGIRAAGRILGERLFFGAGPGRFGGYIARKTKSPEYKSSMEKRIYLRLHGYDNVDLAYCRIFGEAGIAGGIAFLSLFVVLFRRFFRTFRDHELPAYSRRIALAASLAAAGILVQGLTACVFEAPFLSFFAWGLFGLAIQKGHI